MRKEELFKRMIIYYFLIFTGSMVSACIYCSIFYPDVTMSIPELRAMMFLALCGDLPLIVFYSEKELTATQYRVRSVIQVIMLEAILLGVLKYFGTYSTFWEATVLAILIFCVYVFIKIISFMIDVRTADSINERLKQLDSEEQE